MPLRLLHSLIFPRFLAMGIEPITMMAIAGGLGALGNFFGSKSAAKSQEAAQRETNATNLRMFQESRGSTGSAVLPEYLRSYEAGLGTSAAETARALFGYGGGASARLASNDAMLQRYAPALEAGDNFVMDLGTGRVGNNRSASLAPVLAARTGAAKTRASSISQGLDETLATLRAQKAASGFRGPSTFETNRTLAATVGARSAAAEALAQAELENALASQGLDESNLQLQLSTLDLPFQRGAQRMSFAGLPATSLAEFYRAALSPLDSFRLPTANPPYQGPNPSYGSTPFAGAAVAAGAQTLGQYLAQQQLMQQLQSFYRQPTYLSSGGQFGAGAWAGPGGDTGPAMTSLGPWAGV